MKKKSAHEGSLTDARESAQEKLDRILELFFSRILSHLHVVVMAHVPVLEGILCAVFALGVWTFASMSW